MSWYLVTKPWCESGHEVVRHSDGQRLPYFGISGDVWPLDEFRKASKIHGETQASMSYVDAPNGTASLVCADLSIANEYFTIAKKHLRFARLLEITFEYTERCDGVDIGSPEGSFSVIESEVVQIGDPSVLNEHGLFRNMSDAMEYLTTRESFDDYESLEEVDGYSCLGVRITGSA